MKNLREEDEKGRAGGLTRKLITRFDQEKGKRLVKTKVGIEQGWKLPLYLRKP